ncbi:Murein DD-endopeptidase MepM and murein hydrolase activator NlpD, contain LysM domain [Devosia lucknowensis]|uniref:Murein DD-endopeptidase MepM and murein hydrolase activator NlpD, contain LysM domain n=1 Tax=Devosia lucknowensis TaxID=1096929 RepID=A0A1Y6GCA4_9HYPH|nr:M23 family metallopeptidase [Devosia lucknowensis]SMQ86358.1 Murein DD-endopeptidase MepM and murein hydrolase activator NlpD, contain LysM domain [Devosia lucknowensis]
MNATQRRRHVALLHSTGFEDSPALTVQSTDGEIPQGRELSFAWLSGTVMTGLTSVLLMGAALYVSFQGQDTFSTAYAALNLAAPKVNQQMATDLTSKTSRLRPVAATRSDKEIIEASTRQTVDGREIIRNQPFVRIRATLATTGTSLSADVPAYDPVAILNKTQPITSAALDIATDVYGTDVDGEVAVSQSGMPANFVPTRAVTDQSAAEFVRTMAIADVSVDGGIPALAYASLAPSVQDLSASASAVSGVAENVTVVPKSTQASGEGMGRTERFLTVREEGPLRDSLLRNGFTAAQVGMVENTLANLIPAGGLPTGLRLRILYGPLSQSGDSLVPYRMSIYRPDGAPGERHIATVALSDNGQYVVGLQPDWVEFPTEDVEQINVGNLPTVYRSIWETGRKHDLSDETIERIIGMFAYDIDMTKRITAGDTIEILEAGETGTGGEDELLYVSLNLSGSKRELYRFSTDDGTVDFYDPDGETGKRFLNRRPLEGGGTLRSRFGYRIHPIFKTRKLHTGVDLAARTGTPIYAAGDGVISYYKWQSGYGNKIEIQHVNGYETAYGHLSRFVDGLGAGSRVRQGQVIGYVGSTGQSTGPHLHFEILINGNLVDPLSVKLPKDNVLAAQYRDEFDQTIAQINDLMAREPAPVTVAQAQ